MAITIKKSHEGKLHEALNVPEGHPIPMALLRKKLALAKKEHNVALEKQLVFAINAHNFHHKKTMG